jgi:hypothetical protein
MGCMDRNVAMVTESSAIKISKYIQMSFGACEVSQFREENKNKKGI